MDLLIYYINTIKLYTTKIIIITKISNKPEKSNNKNKNKLVK